MNRIDELFQYKKKSVLSIYFTAGYPELEDTTSIISGLESAGADLIEIGFPFSDPVADGPVIQESSHHALQNGMNLDILFGQLETIKGSSRIPKILMGYYNTVYQYGIEKFIEKSISCGISGVILPDLPPEVYEKEYRQSFEAAGLHFICLAAPQTAPERAAYLANLTRGFLYRLSMSSTTGTSVATIDTALDTRVNCPVLIGFGIHDRTSFEMACRHANGAIIGTSFIKYLTEQTKDNRPKDQETRRQKIMEICKTFVDSVRG